MSQHWWQQAIISAVLTYHQHCSVAAQFHKKCSWTSSVTCAQEITLVDWLAHLPGANDLIDSPASYFCLALPWVDYITSRNYKFFFLLQLSHFWASVQHQSAQDQPFSLGLRVSSFKFSSSYRILGKVNFTSQVQIIGLSSARSTSISRNL